MRIVHVRMITNRLPAAVIFALCLWMSFLAGCSVNGSSDSYKSESYFIFDTIVTVKIYDARASDEHFDEIGRILEQIDAKMSRTSETSEIGMVNANAGIRPVAVSSETLHLVQQALDYAERTDGKFDPTVGPLVDVWGIGGESPRRPPDDMIAEAAALTDYRLVKIDRNKSTVYLEREGMALDLGAIAKGYAADRIAEYLRSQKLHSAIIDLGGNILATGYKPDGSEWTIGVQNPDESRGTIIGTLKAHDQSIVSSGVYERYFIEDGVRYHHILDTENGYPVRNGLTSVTIVTGRSTDADALSTSVFSLGPEEGYAFVEALDGVEAIFITEDRKVRITSGLTGNFTLTDETFVMIE